MSTYYSDTTDAGAIRTAKWRDVKVGDAATDDVSLAQLVDAAFWAYARINSKLAKAYAVPFTTTPDEIIHISDNLTIAQAKATGSGHSVRAKGPWSDLLKDADERLDALAKGTEKLPGVARRPSGLSSSTEGEHGVFGAIDDDFDYGQDPDQAERIAGERD